MIPSVIRKTVFLPNINDPLVLFGEYLGHDAIGDNVRMEYRRGAIAWGEMVLHVEGVHGSHRLVHSLTFAISRCFIVRRIFTSYKRLDDGCTTL